MKKLVKQDNGTYSTEDVTNVFGHATLILGAPFTGLAGTPHAGGQARANTIVSTLIGGILGATIAYPIIRKGVSVASAGKLDDWLESSHVSNRAASSGAGATIL